MAYKSPFWATFEDGSAACVEGETQELAIASGEAAKGKKVAKIDQLPYPATPRISAEKSDCPSFCYTPRTCAGRGSCPKYYACSE